MWSYVSNDNQRWILDYYTNLLYTVESIQHNLCYDSNNAASNGDLGVFRTCDPSNPNQQWFYGSSNNGILLTTNSLSHNMCLDNNGATSNGVRERFWTCNQWNSNQQWTFS